MRNSAMAAEATLEFLAPEVPECLEEAERLGASIERAVERATGYGVRSLRVEVNEDGILLEGRCATYYCKQLAQHAVMSVADGRRLTNRIEVA